MTHDQFIDKFKSGNGYFVDILGKVIYSRDVDKELRSVGSSSEEWYRYHVYSPECPTCGNSCRFIKLSKGYGPTCEDKNCMSSNRGSSISIALSNPEVVEKKSESSKKMWQSAEYRERMSLIRSELAKSMWRTEEYRTKMSEVASDRISDPEYRKNLYLSRFKSSGTTTGQVYLGLVNSVGIKFGVSSDCESRIHRLGIECIYLSTELDIVKAAEIECEIAKKFTERVKPSLVNIVDGTSEIVPISLHDEILEYTKQIVETINV